MSSLRLAHIGFESRRRNAHYTKNAKWNFQFYSSNRVGDNSYVCVCAVCFKKHQLFVVFCNALRRHDITHLPNTTYDLSFVWRRARPHVCKCVIRIVVGKHQHIAHKIEQRVTLFIHQHRPGTSGRIFAQRNSSSAETVHLRLFISNAFAALSIFFTSNFRFLCLFVLHSPFIFGSIFFSHNDDWRAFLFLPLSYSLFPSFSLVLYAVTEWNNFNSSFASSGSH